MTGFSHTTQPLLTLCCLLYLVTGLLFPLPVLPEENYQSQFDSIFKLAQQAHQELEQAHYERAQELNTSAQQQTDHILQTLRQLPDSPSRNDKLFSALLHLANTYQNQAQINAAQAMEARFQNAYSKAETLQEQAVTDGQKALATQQEATDLLKQLPDSAKSLPTMQTQIHSYEFMLAGKLKDLGVIYHAQERRTDATRLLDESRTLLERLQPHIPTQDFAPVLQTLAMAYQEQGNSDQANKLFQQINAPITGADLDARALQHLQAGEIDQAIPLLHQALALAQATPENKTGLALEVNLHKLRLPMTLNALGQAYVMTGKYLAAQQYFKQNLALPDNHLPPSHPGSRASSLDGLALVHKLTNQIPKALEYVQQAYAEYDAYAADTDREHTNAKQGAALAHLSILRRGLNNGQLQSDQAIPEAFLAAQLAHGSTRLEAFRQIALRLAADQPTIRTQLQTLWDQQTHLLALDKQYTTSLTNPSPQAAADTERLQQDMQQTRQTIQQRQQQLAQTFPAYQALAHPEPLPLAQAQALLQADEALLVWVEATAAPGKSTLFVVRPNRATSLHELEANREVLQPALDNPATGLLATLRDPQKPFNLNLAHGLYQQLFAPAEKELEGVKHIIAVADGSLHNLPLHVLLKSAPPTNAAPDNATYAKADWLSRHYAFSYLPSVHSLADLRETGSANRQASQDKRTPFLGFGDPLLEAGNPQQTSLFRADLARLPDTASEIRAIAQLLNADPQTSVYLAENATETRLKQLDRNGELKRAKVISFATHALSPQEDTDAPEQSREAGLVLTPPDKSSGDDDGYLSASEIATLKLDADWVLLSACNTGTLADGEAREGLSALSRAFFMAGTHSVLASHWPVESRTTAQLMTGLFGNLQANTGLRRAEALHQSMVAVLDAPSECGWLCWLGWQKETYPTAHPAFWAPFVVYGEGSAIE